MTVKNGLAPLTGKIDPIVAKSREELTQPNAARIQIERRQQKLLEAHYNDAIPLNLLRREQKELEAELTQITKDLDTLDTDLGDAEKIITVALDLAEFASSTYKNAPNRIKRLMNQAIFKQLLVVIDKHGDHQIKTDMTPGFGAIFSPATKAMVNEATTSAKSSRKSPKSETAQANSNTVEKRSSQNKIATQQPENRQDMQKAAQKPLFRDNSLRKITVVALLTCNARNCLTIAKHLNRDPHIPVIVPRQKVRGRVLSKTDQKKLVKAYEGGATIRELAEEYATSKLVIKNTLRANSVRIKLTRPTERDVKVMIRLYESGLSLARTGEQVGFDPVTVRKYLLTKGVEMRNTRGE